MLKLDVTLLGLSIVLKVYKLLFHVILIPTNSEEALDACILAMLVRQLVAINVATSSWICDSCPLS